MEFLKRFFSIERWTYKELLIFIAAFLLFNIFAPRGFIQWLLIQQDIRRVRTEMHETKSRISKLENELKTFQGSELIKEQKLRELGYLKPSEISLEFVDTNRKNASGGRRTTESSEKVAR